MVLPLPQVFRNTQAKVPNGPSDCHLSEGVSHSAFFSLSDLWTFKPYRTCVFTCRSAGGPYILQKCSIPNQGDSPTFISNPRPNRMLTPTRTKNVPYPPNGRSAAESRLVGMKDYTLIGLCISQQHPPDIVSGSLSAPPQAPLKHAALNRV